MTNCCPAAMEICNHAYDRQTHKYACPLTGILDGYGQIGKGGNFDDGFSNYFSAVLNKSSGVILTSGGLYSVQGSNSDPFVFFVAKMTRERVDLIFFGISTIESVVTRYLSIEKKDRNIETFLVSATHDINQNDNEVFSCPGDSIDQFQRLGYNDFFKSSQLEGKYVLLIVLQWAYFVERNKSEFLNPVSIRFHEVVHSQSSAPAIGAASTEAVDSVQTSEMNSAAGPPLRDHSAIARQVSVENSKRAKLAEDERQQQDSKAQKEQASKLYIYASDFFRSLKMSCVQSEAAKQRENK